jgi:hypothetical protein
MMHIRVHADARAFLARAEQWLVLAEIEHAMALQSARFARAQASRPEQPSYWATVEDGEQIVGCAFCLPPYRLGLTALPKAAVPALVASIGVAFRTLSGVAGPEPATSAFAAAWAALRDSVWFVQSRQHMLAHKVIVPTRKSPPGALRIATDTERTLAEQWGAAFAAESGLAGLDGSLCARLVHDRRLYLWDDGAPQCMLGVLRETRDAAAIGILYTPDSARDRGYATASVAAFSGQLLARGVKHSYFCLDPANAAAYSICRSLGYDVVQQTVDIDFATRKP